MAGPLRIEWQAPEGIRVVLDEDGVQLRFPTNLTGLEEGDLSRLLCVIEEAKQARTSGVSPIPTVPSKGEWAYASHQHRARYIAKRAAAAVLAELEDTIPF